VLGAGPHGPGTKEVLTEGDVERELLRTLTTSREALNWGKGAGKKSADLGKKGKKNAKREKPLNNAGGQ